MNKNHLYIQLEMLIQLNGLEAIVKAIKEICDGEVRTVAVQFQDAQYAKKWAACSEACVPLERAAKEISAIGG
jgi:hypothetical protein